MELFLGIRARRVRDVASSPEGGSGGVVMNLAKAKGIDSAQFALDIAQPFWILIVLDTLLIHQLATGLPFYANR